MTLNRLPLSLSNKMFSESSLIGSMEDNWFLFMTYLACYSPSMKILSEEGDVHAIMSREIFDDSFNFVLRAHFSSHSAYQRVDQIIKIFQNRSLPFAWYVGPSDTPKDLNEILKKFGLTLSEENIGMYLDISSYTPHAINSLTVERVFSKDQLVDFDQVNIKSGESPHFEVLFRHLPALIYDQSSPWEFYVGYIDDVPVTTGIIVFHAGVAGIYFVATVPEARRRGYAQAMMECFFSRSKERGYSVVTLQATNEGKFLYQKLGFKELSVFYEYSWKP